MKALNPSNGESCSESEAEKDRYLVAFIQGLIHPKTVTHSIPVSKIHRG